jgi:hypothetical protein
VCDPEWEAIGKQIMVEFDEAERLQLWEQWWEKYVAGAYTITLFEFDSMLAMNTEFDWTPRADGWFTFRGLKLAE